MEKNEDEKGTEMLEKVDDTLEASEDSLSRDSDDESGDEDEEYERAKMIMRKQQGRFNGRLLCLSLYLFCYFYF